MEIKPLNRSEGCNPQSSNSPKLRRMAKAALVAALVLASVFMASFVNAYAAEESVQKLAVSDRHVLVLDAGHGGNDPGAVNAEGVMEADMAQHVLDRLVPMLQAHKDELQLVLTHDAGENPSINSRAAVANQNDADLFISLHLNAAERTGARGFQVYPTPLGRAYHEDSYRFAELLVNQVAETGIPIFGDKGIYYAFYRNGEKEFYDADTYAGMTPINRSTFGVLDGSDCPSVLVEQWFITNPEDMAMFNNTEGKQAMARQLYRAICDYFNLEYLY